MQLYSVQLIPGKAEITEDKGMYSRAPGPPDPRLITYSTCINILFYIMDVGISAKIQSCGFILPVRKNMITLFHYEIFIFLCPQLFPNFEKVGRAYCFRLVCMSVCACVSVSHLFLNF